MHVAPLGIRPSSFNDLIEGESSFNPIMSEGENYSAFAVYPVYIHHGVPIVPGRSFPVLV
jgi:hypothetical protein